MHQFTSRRLAALLVALLAGCGTGGGDIGANVDPSCQGYPERRDGKVTLCEARVHDDLPATGNASITTSNGDILSRGSGRDSIRLEAYVYATAATEDAARAILGRVTIHTDANQFYATGPSGSGTSGCNVELGGECVTTEEPSAPAMAPGEAWWVSFAAALPRATDLSATASNGEVEVDNVSGTGSYVSSNGNLYLAALAGALTADSGNGNIDLDLTGSTWSGSGATLSSGNGSIVLHAPSGYSAHFQLSSINGTAHSDFSGQTQDGPNAQIDETTGNGGPTLKASTTNGDVALLKKS